MNKLIRVCQVVASINENTGGTAYSVTSLAHALAYQNIASHIFTLDYQCCGKQIIPENVKLHSERANTLAKYIRGFQPSANSYLLKLASSKLDLIHNHGLWMFPNLYARRAALKNRLPLVISPRGMLENWSLKNGWYKKWLAWLLYERKNLHSATIFHATSTNELHSIRKLGFKHPIALIPNGIEIPFSNQQTNRGILINLFPEIANKKWLLFLSRIHPKKGLDNLIYVWHEICKKFPDWHLIIAGPDRIGYKSKIEKLTWELNLQKQVTFTGMLSGQIKTSAIANADLFVLPTHSENFGIVVAESLAHEVPVITTKGAPWEDLIKYDCGWWIDNERNSLKNALIEAMNLSEDKRRQMGINGKIMVEKKYSWNFLSQKMSKVYSWILGTGNLPDCIEFSISR